MTREEFVSRDLLGEQCYLCEKPIKKDQPVRYYGGPFIMHSACIDKIINHTEE